MENALAGWYTTAHTIEKEKKTYFSSFILWFETRCQRMLMLEALERDWCGPGEVILLALELSYIKTLESTAGKRDLRDSGALPYRFAAPPHCWVVLVEAHIQWITRCVSVRNKKKGISSSGISVHSRRPNVYVRVIMGCGNSFHNPPKKQFFSLSLSW